jgi:hypothetical protein
MLSCTPEFYLKEIINILQSDKMVKRIKYVNWTEFIKKDEEKLFWNFIGTSTENSINNYWTKFVH